MFVAVPTLIDQLRSFVPLFPFYEFIFSFSFRHKYHFLLPLKFYARYFLYDAPSYSWNEVALFIFKYSFDSFVSLRNIRE